MKALIFYYSNTGNTRILCELIQKKVTAVHFELISITEEWNGVLETYDFVGFACFTDQMQIPDLMRHYMKNLRVTGMKYAFILNTYGAMSGRTLRDLEKGAQKCGYTVIDGISVHTPENYPPMIKRGFPYNDEPSDTMMNKVKEFIKRIGQKADAIGKGGEIGPISFKTGAAQMLLPRLPMFLSKLELGKITCVTSACTQCKICFKGCPAKAITFNTYPEIDNKKCHSCWRCYNRCPSQAIVATKFGKEHRYPKVHQSMRKKVEQC